MATLLFKTFPNKQQHTSFYQHTTPRTFENHPCGAKYQRRGDGRCGAKASFFGQLQKTESNVTLHLDLPGVKPSDIQIQYHEGLLKIHGQRKVPGSPEREFHREYAIDQTILDVSQIKANLSDGVLAVMAPRKDKKKPKIVQVTNHDHQQSDKEVTFSVDLPGVKDAKVEYDGGLVTIMGKRKVGGRVKTLFRNFRLDETSLDTTGLAANLSEGVLVVSVPKKEREDAKTIEVASHPHDHVEDESKAQDEDKQTEVVTVAEPDIQVETVDEAEEDDKQEETVEVDVTVSTETDTKDEEDTKEMEKHSDENHDDWEEVDHEM